MRTRIIAAAVAALSLVLVGFAAADDPGRPEPPPVQGVGCVAPTSIEPISQGELLSPGEFFQTRTGMHECFDRVVFDIAGEPGGVKVDYVTEITSDPAGFLLDIPNAGGILQVRIPHELPRTSDRPRDGEPLTVLAPGVHTVKSVIQAGSFEGISQVAIGVDGQQPFRAFLLPRRPGLPGMIVIDIAHAPVETVEP